MPAPLDYASPPLRRQIGLFGAVMLGLGSILGTGVFVGLAQATALAGPWVLLAIVLAGLLAFCNAMSSAQLAAAYPVSGGTYEYGYRLLSPAWGFTAGWTFLLAKSASAATAALALGKVLSIDHQLRESGIYIGSYSPEQAARLETVATFIVMIGVVAAALAGLRRTNVLNAIIVALTIAGLAFFVAMVGSRPWFRIDNLWNPGILSSYDFAVAVLSATPLVFVAFTGYGRLATLGEEVERANRNIPLAIMIVLAVTVLVYLAVGCVVASTNAWYPRRDSVRSLVDLATMAIPPWSWYVRYAALTAMLGVLLNLILGLSRVWLAMGRRGDMPRLLVRVSERSGTPVPATIVAGLVIAAIVLVGDVRLTWSFSAFSVLIYYAITNWACLRLPAEQRRYPRALAWIGLVSCLSLAWFVEMKVWAVGVAAIVVGLVWHRLRAGVRSAILVPSPGTPGEG